MVSRSRERVRQLSKNPCPPMLDFAGLPVKQFRRAHNLPAKRRSNRLMPKAHPKNRNLPRQFLDKLHRNARLLRRARPGRNHNPLRLALGNLLHVDAVVAMYFHLAAQFAQILRQVIGERIVVVQKQNHDLPFPFPATPCAASSARSSAFDLFTDSSNSPCGVESATIPPPACT